MAPPQNSLASSVSVVVPCYNAEGHVERAVRTALRQSHPPTEVICVDDGSTDETLGVLRSLERSHRVVRVLAGPRRGAPAARNWGLAEATGSYVQFLDADDELDEGKLEAQVALLERGADFVAGGYRHRRLDGHMAAVVAEPGNPWVRLLQKRLGITSANLWRRSAVEAVGGWDEGLASSQEADLMVRMLQREASVAFGPEPQATVHAREGSISDGFSRGNRERYVRVRAAALLHCEQHGILGGEDLEAAREAVFKSIRGLYPYDRPAARTYYREALPPRYVPPVSAFNTGPYVAAFRVLGFAGAERLRALWR